jgi:hypothetical protein
MVRGSERLETRLSELAGLVLAEEVRFELTEPCGSSVFKTDAIDHSATLPSI